MSNSLDPDQAQHFVGPDLGPNCLEGYKQTPLDTSRQRVRKIFFYNNSSTISLMRLLNKSALIKISRLHVTVYCKFTFSCIFEEKKTNKHVYP